VTIRNAVVAISLVLSPICVAAQALRVEPTPAAASAPTSIPALVPYTGTALAADGKPLAGETYVTFRIFKDERGGAPLWTEGQITLVDSAGRYKVQMGAASPSGLPSDLFSSGEARWLEVQISGQPELPRVLLASVPYALKAGDATTLGGLPASAFALKGNGTVTPIGSFITPDAVTAAAPTAVTTVGGATGYIPKFTGAATVANSLIFDTGGTVGIGVGATPNSSVKLDVGGGMIVRGNTIVSRMGNATASKGYGSWGFEFFSNAYNSSLGETVNPFFTLQSEATGNNTASPSATFNLLFSNGGTPAETGFSVNSSGAVHFASGQSFPSGSTAVAHDATLSGNGTNGSPLGLTIPVVVTSIGTGITGTGVTGVAGYSNFAGGTGLYGVANNGSGSDFGVWGVSSSGYAGVFDGNVYVNGTLSKAAGTFKIDDPLDPANKYLSHSFVESPDMMNIYNGNAQLDGNGQAVVQLPDYFIALNKEYRYQLTAMGAPGPNLYVAEEVKGNQFKIAGGQAGSKVSWQVTGIRQDAYANAHRTPIEEAKPGKERGTYLHPELFGQPEEMGREWAVHPATMAKMKKDRLARAGVSK
jgi:hypothetical protein